VNLPSGTVTFLFTDIEGSTKLAQQYPDAMPALLARHHEILNQSIQAHNGYVFQVVGDSFAAAFHSAGDALNAVLEAQRHLHNEAWSPAPIKVRMGIHTGTAHLNDKSAPTVYSGYATLALTQRIMSAGHGRQILLSGATRELVRDTLAEDTELLDLGERRLKDSIHPEHLYQLNASGLPTNFPPLKTLDSFRNNLPVQLTTFIGRKKEIVEIQQELKEHRLVTLIGTGGIGKTRLSLETAHAALSPYFNGVWFIELAPLSDAMLLPQTLLNTLGLMEQASRSPLMILTDFLKDKRTLLILDNCEHLIEACAQLAESLLLACPNLHILATSREALGIPGEAQYLVPTLTTPDPLHATLDTLRQYEAAQLFIERAQSALREFSITPDNATAIGQICSHLDGIPLALELAAARVNVLGVEQIAARLNDRFRLLKSSVRTALPRHQTLQAMIDWSHDLLSEVERVLLRRLSIFVGGWTLESAEFICGGDGINDEIIDLLTQLLNKSLVLVDHNQGQEVRYRMLETIRQYSLEKLWAAGEAELIRERHLMYFVDLGERAEPNLRSFDMVKWLDRLEAEHDNIRVALAWALESNIEAQLRLAGALLWFWHIRGHRQEGIEWLEQGLSIDQTERGDQPITPSRAMIRGKALNTIAVLESVSLIGKPAERLEESRALFEALGPAGKQGMAYALLRLADWTSDVDKEKAMLDESLALFYEIRDKFGIAECLISLTGSAWREGDYERANALEKEHLALRKEIGDKDGIAIAYAHSGNTAFLRGNYEEAKKLLEESLADFREVNNKLGIGLVLTLLSDVAWEQGDHEQAVRVIEEALVLGQDLGDKAFIASRLGELGLMAWAHGDYKQATQKFEASLAISQEVGSKIASFFALQGLGRVAQSQGEYAAARSLYMEAMVLCQEMRIRLISALHLAAFAILAAAQNQMQRAARLFGAVETQMPSIRFAVPVVRAEHDRAISATRAALGQEAFAATWEEGQKMTLEQAIALATETG
jgi:predicted ATPase/class 3 adenylate cyclase